MKITICKKLISMDDNTQNTNISSIQMIENACESNFGRRIEQLEKVTLRQLRRKTRDELKDALTIFTNLKAHVKILFIEILEDDKQLKKEQQQLNNEITSKENTIKKTNTTLLKFQDAIQKQTQQEQIKSSLMNIFATCNLQEATYDLECRRKSLQQQINNNYSVIKQYSHNITILNYNIDRIQKEIYKKTPKPKQYSKIANTGIRRVR